MGVLKSRVVAKGGRNMVSNFKVSRALFDVELPPHPRFVYSTDSTSRKANVVYEAVLKASTGLERTTTLAV